MTRREKFAQQSPAGTDQPLSDNNIPMNNKMNNITPKVNPRSEFRKNLTPEPTPEVDVSPLTAPKLNKEYSTLGISSPPKTNNAPPVQNNAPSVGALPPPKSEATPPPASTSPPPPSAPPEQTAASQSFSPPSTTPPGGEQYTMPGNYAKRTAEDIFNGANYFLKWTVAPWLYVPLKREFIRFEKATKRMAEITQKAPASKLNERLDVQNAKTRDTMALDDEDKELFVPPFSAWFHESGFHLSPGGRAAFAAIQISLRKLGDVGKIRRENKEFLAELQEEVSRFLEVYDKEIKPALDELEKNKTQVPPPPPPAAAKTEPQK